MVRSDIVILLGEKKKPGETGNLARPDWTIAWGPPKTYLGRRDTGGEKLVCDWEDWR
jgi:hypothetical protein